MKRNFTKVLIKWKEDNCNIPLMVIGARQIGKTYTIEEFCKQNFEEYIYINLEKMDKIKDIFESSLDPEMIIERIEVLLDKKINIDSTIIFIDEIQVSEKAVNSLKYFCEDKKQYKIIVAGSLLGVKLNRFGSSFPVGKVLIEHMYPMTFDEFLIATGREKLKGMIEKSYNDMEALPMPIHEMAIELYKKYLCVGGMPKAVENFIEEKEDIVAFNRKITESIILSYLSDMTKYTINKSEAIKITSIYNKMPAQLAKDNRKFNYRLIGEHANKRDFETALDWLISSSMIYKCNLVNTPRIPLKAYIEDSIFKAYISDTGILVSLCNILFSDIVFDNDFIFKGALTENYVAQTFISNSKNLYYWKSNSLAEIDFLLYNEDGIIPVEVKSSNNTTSKSLNSYIKRFEPKYAIRLSTKNFGYENNIKSIPLYATYLI